MQEKTSEKTKNEFLSAYDTYADALYKYCYFKIHDTELATDMVSDVFLKTWKYLVLGNEITNLKAFLYKLAGNLVIDLYRKKRTLSLDILQESGFEPADAKSETETKAEYEQALKTLSKLPFEEQELICLRFINDLSPREIAEILNQKENNISVKIHRAVKHLQELNL